MKATIIGSGGAVPVPRAFCQCDVCIKARNIGYPYKRHGSALYIHDIDTLIDCGEDIVDALNDRDIKNLDNLFITHWHPDHTFGLRPLLQSYIDFVTEKVEKQITIYLPKKVHEDLKKHFPSISYFVDVLGLAKIIYIEHNETVNIGDVCITCVGFTGVESETFGYLLEQHQKKLLYTPCDTINFKQEIKDIDVFITECGIFDYDKVKTEIGFPELMIRIKKSDIKKTILTHIEEIELRNFGRGYLEEMKQKYSEIPFEFGYDGLKIEI